MHEMHIVKDLFSDLLRVSQEHNAQKITNVYIRIGEFTEINEEIVRFFFAEKGRGTPAEHAEVQFERSPVRELRLVSFDHE